MLQSSSIDFGAAIILLECIRADLISMRSEEIRRGAPEQHMGGRVVKM